MELPKEKELTNVTSSLGTFIKHSTMSKETLYMQDNFCEQTAVVSIQKNKKKDSTKDITFSIPYADIIKQVYLIFYVEKEMKISSLFDSIGFGTDCLNAEHLSSTFIETLNTLQNGDLVSTEGDKRRIMLRVPFFFTHGYNQIIDDIYDRAGPIMDVNILSHTRVKRLRMNGIRKSVWNNMEFRILGVSPDILDVSANITCSTVWNKVREMKFPMYCYGYWETSKCTFSSKQYENSLTFDIKTAFPTYKFIFTLRDADGVLVPIKTILLGVEMTIIDHFTGDFLQKKSHQTDYIYVHDDQGLIDDSKLRNLWGRFKLYDNFDYKYPLTSSVDYNFIKTIKLVNDGYTYLI